MLPIYQVALVIISGVMRVAGAIAVGTWVCQIAMRVGEGVATLQTIQRDLENMLISSKKTEQRVDNHETRIQALEKPQ